MATTTIPWGDGSGGNIYLTYSSASGDQTVEVSSDANTVGTARTKTVTFAAGNVSQVLTVNQEAAVVAVPYIRGGADGSYIDTRITPDVTTKVIVWARNFNPATNYTWLFGSREAVATHQFGIYGCTTYNTGKIGGLYASEAFYTGDAFSLMSGYHKYELNGNVFSVDDTVVASATAATITSSKPIYLFGLNSDNTLASPTSPIDICACKIYKNGVLVRDFTAVDSPSVGLYDSVSDTVFTNAGSGVFTYGEFNPHAYTPLQYITCSKAQYFDTGIKGTYGLPIVAKFMPTNATAQWTTLLGTRVSSPANSCDISFGTATAGENNMRCYWRFGANTTNAQAFSGSKTNKLTNKEVIVRKTNATLYVYYNWAQIGSNAKSGVSSSFETSQTIAIGTYKTGDSSYSSQCFIGRLYYVGFQTKNFVPAKVNDVAGMYDTYNDVFYSSDTDTAFVAGPEL